VLDRSGQTQQRAPGMGEDVSGHGLFPYSPSPAACRDMSIADRVGEADILCAQRSDGLGAARPVGGHRGRPEVERLEKVAHGRRHGQRGTQ